MRRPLLLAALLAVATATACSNASNGSAPPSPPTSATLIQVDNGPTTHEGGPSTSAVGTDGQYAGIVARHEPAIAQARAALSPCEGQFGGVGPVCTTGWRSYALAVSSLAGALEDAETPSNSAYIGPAPAEIHSLVVQTLTTAADVERAQSALSTRCRTGDEPRCSAAVLRWLAAADAMQGRLDGWRLFIG